MNNYSILQTYYRSPSKRMHELEDHLIETWRNLIAERKAKSENTRATLSRDIGMISISPDDRLVNRKACCSFSHLGAGLKNHARND